MGLVIQSVAVSTDPSIRSSIAHAGHATRECVKAAGVSATDVGVLINVGVYRDANMAEPAMAAMIQKEAGINPDYVQGGSPTISFDLMNGACGVLNAVQVASALLATRTVRHVLVVSSDTHPSNARVASFPYATLGAAMILGASDDATRGFGAVRVAQTTDGVPGVEGYVPWMTGGHEVISVDVHPQFAARALGLATTLGRETIEAEKLDRSRTLLVSSHPTPRFAQELAGQLGIEAFVAPEGLEGDPNSSALTWGYERARALGLDAKYDTLLFVAAGSGISAAAAVYRR